MTNVLEEAVVKAVARFGVTRVTTNGFTGVFRRLAEEHKELSVLLKRTSVTSALDKQAILWATFRAELAAHEQAELQEVYPDFEWHPSLIDVIQTHEEDAERLQDWVRGLDAVAIGSPQWGEGLQTLGALLSAHVEREEELFFPQVQRLIGRERIEELDARYTETKRALLGLSRGASG